MSKALLVLFGAVTALVMLPSPAYADRGQGVLTGVVRDVRSGKGIGGALVIVRRNATQVEDVVVTDADGYYRLPNVVPGDYEVLVTTLGYHSKGRSGIHVQAGVTLRVDVGMAVGGEILSRTVVVEAPVVDIGGHTTGVHIDRELARRVPIVAPGAKGAANRSFEAIAELTPGAQLDTYGTSVAGTTSPENLYLVNGLSVGNPGFGVIGLPLSVEFLQEVHVESAGYTAESGRSTGAILNAVTKTGANKFFGSVWVNAVPGPLEGRRAVPRREAAAIVLQQALRWQGDSGFDLGGYLVKDRLWFYTGLQVARTVYDMRTAWYRTTVDPVSGEAVVDDATGFSRTTRISGSTTVRRAQGTALQIPLKLTYRAGRNHQIELFGLYAPSSSGGHDTYGLDPKTGLPEISNGLGTFESQANLFKNQASNLQFNWAASSEDKAWHVDTMVGWHHQIDKQLASDGGSLASPDGLGGVPNVLWQRNADPGLHSATDFVPLPAGFDPNACDLVAGRPTCPVTQFTTGGPRREEAHFDRIQARNIVTRHARGLGHHVIKFGFDIEYARYRDVRALAGGRYYAEDFEGKSFIVEELGLLVGPDKPVTFDRLDRLASSNTLGGFLQDSWAIKDRVTVNLGLRYDAQHLFTAGKDLMLALPNQLSPRIGVIWDPARAGRAKLFASYGRSYQNIPLYLANRTGAGNPVIYSTVDARPGHCDPSDPQSHLTACHSASELLHGGSPTRADQYWRDTGSGRAPVDPAIKPQSRDEVVLGGELEVTARARLGLTYSRNWLNRVIEDMSRDEGQTYFIGNPGSGIASDFPRAQRLYDAATLFFSRRFARGWGLEASYTLSYLRGNVSGLFRPENGQLWPNQNSDFDLVPLLRNRTGALPADHRHNAKVFGAGEIPIGRRDALLLGASVRALSGGPTNALAAYQYYDVNESFLIPRGAGQRLPWQFRVDTNLGYSRRLGADAAVTVAMTVYNILNLQAVSAVDEAYTFASVFPTYARSVAELDKLMPTSSVDKVKAVKNPNFGNPLAYQPPRQFQFSLRLDF